MRILLSLALLLSLFSFPASAQDTIRPEWVLRRSSPVPNGNAEAWGIAADGTGNLYWSTNQDGSGFLDGLDAVTYKLDADGDELWPAPNTYKGQFAQQIYAADVAGDTLIICGRNCRSNSVNLELCDMLIIAIDISTGDTLWTSIWDRGYGYEEADGIAVVHDGIYITGWSDGGATNWDAGIVKLGRDGKILWSNAWGSSNNDHQDGHIVMDDTVIYGAGLYNGGISTVIVLRGYDGQSMLAKFSRTDGSYMEHTTFGRNDSWLNFENALGMTSDGEFLYVVGNTTVAPNDNQLFIRKFDKNLHQIWETFWGGPGTETARSIAVAPDGMIYVGASTNTYGAGDYDGAILRITPDGSILSFRTWGGAGNDQIYDLILHNGFLYATGRTQSFHPQGKGEGFLFKAGADGIAGISSDDIDDISRSPSLSGNHPDPFTTSTSITFTVHLPGYVRLSIHDMLGREAATLLARHLEPGTYTLPWHAAGYPAGRYLCRLVADGKAATDALALEPGGF